MFHNYKMAEDAPIEKKIFNNVLQQVDMNYQELHEKYQEEFPESLNGIEFSAFAVWFRRSGMRLRRIMSLLALIKHTIVIVPAGADVTVTMNGKKSVNRETKADTVTVFAYREQSRDIRVETLVPQAIEDNVEAPFRKRRSVTAREKEREAETFNFVASAMAENKGDRDVAERQLAEIKAAVTETETDSQAAIQALAEKKAVVDAAIVAREDAKKVSAQMLLDQRSAAQDAKKKIAQRKEIIESARLAELDTAVKKASVRKLSAEITVMRTTLNQSPAELAKSEALLSELKTAVQSAEARAVEQRSLAKSMLEEINEAKQLSAQKMTDQQVAASTAEEKAELVKKLKVELKEAKQYSNMKKLAATEAAERWTALQEAIEQAQNPDE